MRTHVEGRRARPVEHAHPGPSDYVRVAVILALVTAAEVSVYYIKAVRPALVPMLLVMAVFKFAMVGLYFMHLKFDSKLFRRLFLTGIVLAIAVYSVVIATFTIVIRPS